MPGQAPGGGAGGRLIVPPTTTTPGGGGGGAPGGGGGGGSLLDGADTTAPAANRFRPPPGFMDRDDAAAVDAESAATPAPVLLNRLRTGAAPWHALARALPALAAKGYDASAVSEETGVTPLDQNLWAVAGTVYASLAAALAEEQAAAERSGGGGGTGESGGESGSVSGGGSGGGGGRMTPAILAAFDGLDAPDRLYPFRFLGAARRAAAAVYVVENGLDQPACEALARALKEWERRPEERRGFGATPADCLAFKALRDARECRRWESAEALLARAAALAGTEGARRRVEAAGLEIREALGGPPLPGLGGAAAEAAAAAAAAKAAAEPGGDEAALARPARLSGAMTLLRLDPDELGVRPMAVVGRFGEVTSADLRAAPRAAQKGPFGAFGIVAAGAGAGAAAAPTAAASNGNGTGSAAAAFAPTDPAAVTWVALPQWRALQLARRPVALSVADCGAVPALTSAGGARSDEDRRRFTGPALLVVDSFVSDGGAGAVAAASAEDAAAAVAAAEAAAGEAGEGPLVDRDPPQYYLVEVEGRPGGRLVLAPGRGAALAAWRASAAFGGAASAAVAAVLFLARPPQRDVPSLPTADSMIQL